MRKLFAMMLLAAMLVSLCACGGSGEPEVTEPVDTFPYPTIHEKLTREAVDAFPIKHADMTEDEMRQLCVDFFRFSKTALWTPDEDWTYTQTKEGKTDQLFKGNVYGGLPYIAVASGNVYRMLEHINEQTGVMDMTEPKQEPQLFGNQCSLSSYWGWARVINSAEFGWSYELVQSKGCLRVGPYTYDDKLPRFQENGARTDDIARENGLEVMCQSYAAMKMADGLVNFTTAGHVMMCSSEPVVVYNAEGGIDAAQSYLTVLDQTTFWSEATNEAGDTYSYQRMVDGKFTFLQLMEKGYLPFTFKEFLGTDPIEETEVSFSHSGDTITPNQLQAGVVTANYGLSDIFAHVKDSDGNTVLTVLKRATSAGLKELNFFMTVVEEEWAPYTGGGYTVEVTCQLATGERPIIYTGALTK